MDEKYAVSVEVCHILTEQEAQEIADTIRDRLNDIHEDVYVCISRYTQVRARESMIPKENVKVVLQHVDGLSTVRVKHNRP